MAKLTAAQRKKLSSSQFALPAQRKFPIHDKSHARNALARANQSSTPGAKKKVKAAVKRKFPSIKQAGSKTRRGGKK